MRANPLLFCILPTLLVGNAMAGAPGTPLIDAERLQSISCESGVVVLDVRSDKIDGQGRDEYRLGHIPCAIHSDYIKDGWRAKVGGVPGMLPPVERLEGLIGGLGIDNGTRVVIAPLGANSKSMASATRVYWTFKLLGHDQVSILDGGTLAYAKDTARALEKGDRSPVAKSFKASPRTDMLVSREDVARAMEAGTVLVDYRRQDEFSGLNRNAKTTRAGTLEGAQNLPLEWLTRDNGGHFRSREALEQIYALTGLPVEAQQVAFCNTGHNASLGWFVAHELLGNGSARMYDGSMAEWSRAEGSPMVRPVAVNDE